MKKSGTQRFSLADVCVCTHVPSYVWLFCDPMDCSLPDSSVHGILQARIGVGCYSSFRGSSWPRDQTQVSCIAGRFFLVWAIPLTAAKSLQSCPTLCNPIDGSLPGSAVPGILQARTLEWVAISFSNAWKWKVKVKSLSRVRLLATPWTIAHQAPPSMGFSRQEYWSGVPSPSPIPLTNNTHIASFHPSGDHHSTLSLKKRRKSYHMYPNEWTWRTLCRVK